MAREMIVGKLRELVRRIFATGHEHEIVEMPTDMGRKVLRVCRVQQCDFMETVAATTGQRQSVAPIAREVRRFQRRVLDAVEKDL